MRIDGEHVQHVQTEFVSRQGEITSLLLVGTQEQILKSATESLAQTLKYGQTVSVTFRPIHPAHTVDLTQK